MLFFIIIFTFVGQYLSPLARFECDKAVLFSPGTLRSKNNDKEMSTGDLDNHFHSALSWKGYHVFFCDQYLIL